MSDVQIAGVGQVTIAVQNDVDRAAALAFFLDTEGNRFALMAERPPDSEL